MSKPACEPRWRCPAPSDLLIAAWDDDVLVTYLVSTAMTHQLSVEASTVLRRLIEASSEGMTASALTAQLNRSGPFTGVDLQALQTVLDALQSMHLIESQPG